MRILHHRATLGHNTAENRTEGSYRLAGFAESVSEEELKAVQGLAMLFILKTHSAQHFEVMEPFCNAYEQLAGVNLSPASFDAMMVSVQLAIMAACNNGFAVTRPPGHHASMNVAEGFCFFNNVAMK